LGAFYRRLAARIGSAKALVATARKIAERYYNLLTKKEAYTRQGMNDYEETYRRKLTKGLAKRAQELGYALVPLQAEALASATAQTWRTPSAAQCPMASACAVSPFKLAAQRWGGG
jgi:hypothetical protein